MFTVFALVIGVGLVMIAVFSTGFGQNTCDECGGRLPVAQLTQQSNDLAVGDWSCPKCGTRFDPQARARNQSLK